jgi:hypothetical protein
MPITRQRHKLGGRRARLALLLVAVLAVALWLRLYGLHWDGGYLFHPDERKILLVVDDLHLPQPLDLRLLLSAESPLNPRFFAYGSLPLYLLRVCANLAGRFRASYATLNESYVVGRVLSALFDMATIVVLYRLGRSLFGRRVGLLAATLTALTVLHIQLAHFYAVDTLLTFFVVLTIYLAVRVAHRPTVSRGLALGAALGMALATKISAAPLVLPIIGAWFLTIIPNNSVPGTTAESSGDASSSRETLYWHYALTGLILTGIASLVTFAVCQPYALLDIVTFTIDVVTESYMARGLADIPYTRQYIGTMPYLYPLQQMVLWSTGVPLGIASLLGIVAALGSVPALAWRRRWLRAGLRLLPLLWVLTYFGIVGSFHVKFLRYMLPVLPFLTLYGAWGLVYLVRAPSALVRRVGIIALVVTLGGTAFYAMAYTAIYRQEHPWIQTTRWLCETLPPNSALIIEHWDDPLPLTQGVGELRCARQHRFLVFPAYNRDTTEKLEQLLTLLEEGDYIVLASNRLYNTIPRLPWRYPLSSRYYELLMGERLGYELVYSAAVYPQALGVRLVHDTFSDPDLPMPRLLVEQESGDQIAAHSINLGRADESYSVYDHPKTLIFQKTQDLSRQRLLELFGNAAASLPAP